MRLRHCVAALWSTWMRIFSSLPAFKYNINMCSDLAFEKLLEQPATGNPAVCFFCCVCVKFHPLFISLQRLRCFFVAFAVIIEHSRCTSKPHLCANLCICMPARNSLQILSMCAQQHICMCLCVQIFRFYMHIPVWVCVCVCEVFMLHLLPSLFLHLLFSTVINNNRALISWPAALINNIHTFINLNYSQSMQLFIENPPNK